MRIVPVTRVNYEWKGRGRSFYVYGYENKVPWHFSWKYFYFYPKEDQVHRGQASVVTINCFLSRFTCLAALTRTPAVGDVKWCESNYFSLLKLFADKTIWWQELVVLKSKLVKKICTNLNIYLAATSPSQSSPKQSTEVTCYNDVGHLNGHSVIWLFLLPLDLFHLKFHMKSSYPLAKVEIFINVQLKVWNPVNLILGISKEWGISKEPWWHHNPLSTHL